MAGRIEEHLAGARDGRRERGPSLRLKNGFVRNDFVFRGSEEYRTRGPMPDLREERLRVDWLTKKLLLVPEDGHGNQDDSDDPEDDVFAAVFFVCHKRKYSITEIGVQVPREIPCEFQDLGGTAGVPARL